MYQRSRDIYLEIDPEEITNSITYRQWYWLLAMKAVIAHGGAQQGTEYTNGWGNVQERIGKRGIKR